MTSGALPFLLITQRADAARVERKALGDLRRCMQPFAAQRAPCIACLGNYNIKTRSISQFAPHFREIAPHFFGTALRFPTRASLLARKAPGTVLPNDASPRSLPRFTRRTAPPLHCFSPFATQHGSKGPSPSEKVSSFLGRMLLRIKPFS